MIYFCSENGDVKLLTKGDNNSVDDRGLYAPGQLWIRRNEVVGRARGLVNSVYSDLNVQPTPCI